MFFVLDTQSFIGRVPEGNLLASAAILYAGALPIKALRIFTILNCVTITLTTFFRHQRRYLQPAISTIWERQQLSLISSLKEYKLTLSGDGRADSPDHSAKYGSYTVVEMSCNKVVDYRLVQVCTSNNNDYSNMNTSALMFAYTQSNGVHRSYQMEKEGLHRFLEAARFDR